MRLWSVHPKYLDRQGLLALWREALLAQAVLAGKTRGYGSHPQLERFKRTRDPLAAIGAYLRHIYSESARRGYSFDSSKILRPKGRIKLSVTRGQIDYEVKHLAGKLKKREPARHRLLVNSKRVHPNPIFSITAGQVERWEKMK